MATKYSFKGTADMSEHDSAIKKSADEVKKYQERVKDASKEATKLGKTNFQGAYASQRKLQSTIKTTTGYMNGLTHGIGGMVGKMGLYGAAAVAAFALIGKAIQAVSRANENFADKVGRLQAQITGGWDEFLNRLSRWDWSNFLDGMSAAVRYSKELFNAKDAQDTYKMFQDVDVARINNQITEKRVEKLRLENEINAALRTDKRADVSSQRQQITAINQEIEGLIQGLERVYENAIKKARRVAADAGLQVGINSEVIGGYGYEAISSVATMAFAQKQRNNPKWTSKDLIGWLFELIKRDVDDPIFDSNELFIKKAMVNDDYASVSKYASQWGMNLTKSMWESFRAFAAAVESRITESSGGKLEEWTKANLSAEQSRASMLALRQQQEQEKRKDNRYTIPSGPTYGANMIGWYEKKIRELQEDIKKQTKSDKVASIQKQIDEYTDTMNRIKFGEGTVEYISTRMSQLEEMIGRTTEQGIKQQLQSEYNTLEEDLLNLQWPQESPQWVAGKIESLKRQLGEAVDDATRESLQAQIDSYTHILNELENRNNRIGEIQAEIKQLQAEASRASGDDLHEKVDKIARLNHELNDLQNKKGSIDWIQEEIRLTTAELNSANTPDKIAELTQKLTNLRVELAKLQNLSNINIEIKTNLDLVQDKINNLNSIASSTNQILGDMGAGFGYISEMIQGGKDWDDLSEAQQKTIETMNTLEEVFNRIGQACQAVLQFFTAMMEADLAATHAANTVAIEAETSAINQNTAAKAAGALTANTMVTSLGEETIAHGANATAATADAAASMVSAGAGQADAASTVAAGAAKSAPFPSNLAVIAAAIAAVIGIMSVIGSLTKFADGGIVGGNSFVGDRVFARVNSGEMILNDRQQANLFNLLNGNVGPQGGNGGGNVHFEIEGTRLVGVLDNIARSRRRVMG